MTGVKRGDRTVILGPSIDLHPGVHDSLFRNPPSSISYVSSEANHIFLFPDCGSSPHADYHWGEFVNFGEGPEVVHSSRWPVLHRNSWVADTDDFGYQMLCGRHALNPEFRESFSHEWSPDLRWDIRCRLENMLTAFAHRSCQAVLFRSRFTADEASEWVARLKLDSLGDAFLEKIRILYPAQAACPVEIVAEKWKANGKFRVVFCGNDYETKNGRLTLQVFQRVAVDRQDVECVYIGNVPQAERPSHLPQNMRMFDSLPRQDVLQCFSSSHILFHPSRFEGLGTVFLEAAAAGMAVVVGCGRGMTHISEVFGDDGALFVDRDRVLESAEEATFEDKLRSLLNNRSLAHNMGWANYERTRSGEYSIDRRNKVLGTVYQDAIEKPHTDACTLDMLPHRIETGILTMTSEQVRSDEKAYRAAVGLCEDRLLLNTVCNSV